MSLDGATAYISTLAEGVAGIKAAPEDPGEKVLVLPIVMTYPARGEIGTVDSSFSRDIHFIHADVLISRTLLPKAIEQAKDILEEFGRRLKTNPTLNGTVSTIVFPFTYTFGQMQWAEEMFIGFQFEIPVKLQDAYST